MFVYSILDNSSRSYHFHQNMTQIVSSNGKVAIIDELFFTAYHSISKQPVEFKDWPCRVLYCSPKLSFVPVCGYYAFTLSCLITILEDDSVRRKAHFQRRWLR
jgi:hypothetical protein